MEHFYFTDDEIIEMAEILESITDEEIVRCGKKIRSAGIWIFKHQGFSQHKTLDLIKRTLEEFPELK